MIKFIILQFFCFPLPLPSPLAVDLALPETYSSHLVNESGIQEVIFAEKQGVPPLIVGTLAPHITCKAGNFSGEEKLEEDAKKEGLREIKVEHFSWGPYPVLSVEAKHYLTQRKVYMAWVGLEEDLGEGLVVVFKFCDTEGGGNSTIWDQFLHRTRALEGAAFWKACGIEVGDEETIYHVGQMHFRVCKRGEKVIAEPMNEITSVEMRGIKEGKVECFAIAGEEIKRLLIPLKGKTQI